MKSKSKSKPKRPKRLNHSPPAESSQEVLDFSFAVARVAVSQICQSVGFKSAQTSALETLTSVAGKYIEALAKSSSSAAASANRTDSNAFDLAAALRDFRASPALTASIAHRPHHLCALSSPDLAEIADFTGSVTETPFAKPVPRPQRQPDSITASSTPRALRPPHVPHWLPEIPEMTAANRSTKRRGGEELWENCAGKKSQIGDVAVRVCREGKLRLGKGRERVRFQLGFWKREKSMK